MRQGLSVFVQQVQGQLVPGTEAHRSGHASLAATLPVRCPRARQEEAEIDQGVVATGDVTEVDADLAVVHLAEPPTPLPLDTDRRRALLGEAAGIQDQHAIGFTQLAADLPGQLRAQGSVVPGNLSDELLQALALLVVQVGDGLRIFLLEVGEQAVDVVVGVVTLLGTVQRSHEGFQEGVQTRPQAVQQARRYLGILTRLLQANTKALVHRPTPLSGYSPTKSILHQRLATDPDDDTVELYSLWIKSRTARRFHNGAAMPSF